ncbi:MAG: cyclic nucleotide-binding domain-containing protein [Candidatus Magnetoovum sp. WYHC-5]|nr:cyclic nucleotide-binding domain-containing protein [Candidatus Magnetoovum sp. WYHC-5]
MPSVDDLKKQSLLEWLVDEELEFVANKLETKTYKAKDSIFKEQEETKGIYMINKGKVEIKRRLQLDTKTKMLIMLRNISSNEIKHTAAGWEHVFSNLEAGIFFGELSVVEGRKNHSAEAVALEDTELFIMSKGVFAELETESTIILAKLMKSIAKSASSNLRQLNKRVLKALIGN